MLGPAGEPGEYVELALSPDGTQVATNHMSGNFSTWLTEFARGVTTWLTFDPAADASPLWSPDESRIVFCRLSTGAYDLYQKASGGAGDDRLLLQTPEKKFPSDWSRDGRFLLFTSQNLKTPHDVWVLPDPGAPREIANRFHGFKRSSTKPKATSPRTPVGSLMFRTNPGETRSMRSRLFLRGAPDRVRRAASGWFRKMVALTHAGGTTEKSSIIVLRMEP